MWMSSSTKLCMALTIFCGIFQWMVFLVWSIECVMGDQKNLIWRTQNICHHHVMLFFPVGEINGLWFLSVVLTQRIVKIHGSFLENKVVTQLRKSFLQCLSPQLNAPFFRHQSSFVLFCFFFLKDKEKLGFKCPKWGLWVGLTMGLCLPPWGRQ